MISAYKNKSAIRASK